MTFKFLAKCVTRAVFTPTRSLETTSSAPPRRSARPLSVPSVPTGSLDVYPTSGEPPDSRAHASDHQPLGWRRPRSSASFTSGR